MASGVMVSDRVVEIFNTMKVRKSCTPEEAKLRLKAVVFCLSPDKKTIIPEEGKQITIGDCGGKITDPYKYFVEMLPCDDCRYALYDCCYETRETKKEDLVFYFWAPEDAPLKSKMIYASSKDAIKKKFAGCKHELQVNSRADIKDLNTLAEKLGGSCITSVEGVRL